MDATLSMIAGERREADLQSAALAHLTQINLDDLVSSFGWQDRPLLAGLLRRVLRNPARTFARQIAEFDNAVEQVGLVGASRHILPNYVQDVRVFGEDNIPSGPFLALANHPGLSDALSLFAALDRPDLQVIALQRPFLQALPHASKQLSCLSEEASSYAAAIRKVGTHLRAGGATLTFPAGHIEPDPNIDPEGAASLKAWARSADVFVRLAPETAILPVLVRGVVWPKAARNWLVTLRRTPAEKDKAAAALQLLANIVLRLKPVGVTVQIGKPMYARDLNMTKTQAMHQTILAEMAKMIRNPVHGRGRTVA
jgi:hypothetical protein